MNNKTMFTLGIFFSTALTLLTIIQVIHVAITVFLLIIVFVSIYSYSTKKDRDIPEDLHGHFESAYEEEDFQGFLEKEKICHVCNAKNNINRKYCRKCNTLIQNITCPVCSTKNPHTGKYCTSCDSILQNKRRS